MQTGFDGGGRMGGAMARRLITGGHPCYVYDSNPKVRDAAAKDKVPTAESLEDLVAQLRPPRDVWLSLPAGATTESAVNQLRELLHPGDIILDCANSHYKDDVRRAPALAAKGIHYLDVGVSGGVWGLADGFCLMVGGEKSVFDRVQKQLRILAPGAGDLARTPGRSGTLDLAEQGLLFCGPIGSGHLVKQLHNGIEYGVMQAYAEGFALLKEAASDDRPSDQRYSLDVSAIAELWRHSSVIRSWLLDLIAASLLGDPDLKKFQGVVSDSGEGRWTLHEAIDGGVPAAALAAALFARFRSQQSTSFSDKLLSAMRQQFGGHQE